MTFSYFMQMFLNGLQLSSIYILIALGFTLIFGILQIVNIAHGSIYMLGGYCIWILFTLLKFNFIVSLIFTIFIVAVIGIIFERLIFHPLEGKMNQQVIAAIGLMGLLEQIVLLAFGYTQKVVVIPYPSLLKFWGTVFPTIRLIIMIIGVILTATLIWWVRKTRAGLALRAVAQDKETSSLYGISSNRFGLLAFGVGCGLAGAAGGLMAPILYVNPFMGAGPLLKIFVVIVIGGLGSISGAVIAGIMIGMVDSFMTTIFDSETAALIGFVLIIIMLVFRPTGIMGHD